MSRTVVSSRGETVVIAPDDPFVMIGGRINPTNRKRLSMAMARHDFGIVEADAVAQVEAGARILEVNAGIPWADEAVLLVEAVRAVQAAVDVPLMISYSSLQALEAALQAYEGKPLVNSVTAAADSLADVLPLVKRFGAAVVGVCQDESGISGDHQVRLEAARKILEAAEGYGMDREDVILDPWVAPVGGLNRAGANPFEIVRQCTADLDVNTLCSVSRISFGLPNRAGLGGTLLAMGIAAGMPCAIADPMDHDVRQAVLAAEVLMGRDPECGRWMAAHGGNPSQVPGRPVSRGRPKATTGS